MQSFAFSPPIKANRGSVRATLPATSGAGFGSGRQLFDPAHVAQASFGYSVAWVISKAPLEGQDDERSTRLHLRFWTFPRSTAEPVVLAVSVPEAHFQPLASCEIPDNRALLIVGASGTVAKINIPHVGRLPSAGDSSSVTVDSVVGRGISAPVVASGSNGVLYISSLGANVVASITLGQDGTFITSRHNLSGANTSRNSGGGGGWSSWVPNVSLSGLLGRRKQQDDASPARGGHAHEGVLRLFCVDGHCFVETAAALTFVSGDGTDDVQWSWNKEFKDGSGRVETILDVAMGTSEIWVLAAGLTAQTAVILTLSRTNADVCTGMMDIAMEDGNTSAPVAATRRAGAASSNNGSTRLHVLDDMNGTIVTRRDVHRCCVAATIRSPQSHVTEPNPSGVVSFASVSLDDSAIAVLTNFGMVRLRGISSQDGSAFADTSMLNVSVRSNASNISRHSQVTPARTTLNRSDALVDSPRDADLSVDVSAVSMHIRAVTQPQRMKYQFTDVEAAEAHGGLDNAWLRASDEIANRLSINPSNWAKGDLTVDDSDGVAFVTNELNRRLAHHTALQQHINGDTKWQRLKLSTQAAIMSRSETLSMYVALRVLHNDACPKNDRLRAELYRSAVVAAANAVRRDDTPHEASSSEIVYGSVDHAALLLAAVNHGLHSAVSDMSIHVKTKIETAAATSELWMAALDGIEAQRGSAAHLLTAELSNMLWTVSRDASESVHSFESVASNFCSIAADALALLVDVASSNPGADVGAISPYANAVVVAIGRVLRFAFSNTLRGQQHIDSLLRRSLFRQPFVANPVGYPRGAPQPVPLPRVDMCNAILSTVEAIAVDFSMMEALFDLGAADRIDWDAAMEVTGPQDIPEWNSARSYAATVRGFYRYFLRRLSQQYREAELYAASKVFERVTDGDVATVWLDFMKKEAPHALWAMHAPAVDSIIASSTLIPFQGLALGDNMMEHRQCSLSLAELEWVAEGRPAVSGKKLENEKRIVTALVTHAPHLSSSAPSTEETVRALLDVNSPASWASAAAIANSVVDSTSRNKLLLAVLSRAFNSEAAHFVGIASDDSLGDRQRTEAFKATATGQIVANSPYLRQLSGDVQVTSAATSAAYAGALYHFVCDAYGDRGAT